MNKFTAILVSLGLLAHSAMAAQLRSRAEAVPGLQASNTVGLGDIWVTVGASSYFRIQPVSNQRLAQTVDSAYRNDFRLLYGSGNKLHRDLILAPNVGATLGLANFLHLEIEGVPWDGEKLGASTARLKFTTPGNDNLRIFGLALILNATLSTEEDIYSKGESTPGFDPLLYFGVVADLDLVKAFHSLPVKAYLNYANMDDYRLVHAYSQHQMRFAMEYMGNRKSWYLKAGAMLYRPLSTRFNPNPKAGFMPAIYEFGLGYRTAVGNRLTFTADFTMDPIHPISFYSKETGKPPKIQVGVSAPLVFNETRSEAIRALIFNEEQRKRYRALAAKNPAPKVDTSDTTAAGAAAGFKVEEIGLEERKATQSKDVFKGVFDEDESEVADKRKQIRSELKQIEDLLQ
jgi:opacity protein-like surface antigen